MYRPWSHVMLLFHTQRCEEKPQQENNNVLWSVRKAGIPSKYYIFCSLATGIQNLYMGEGILANGLSSFQGHRGRVACSFYFGLQNLESVNCGRMCARVS